MIHRVGEAVGDLLAVFRSAKSKHEAHRAAAPLMEQLTREPAFLSAIIESYLLRKGTLDRKNYPVVGMEIAENPWFGLVANCWIPLPDRATSISTKCIHHHGNMLLTTATLFGPGYEHWMFSRPVPHAGGNGVHTMELLERAPHPQHHVSFVDAWVAHTPFYPQDLSITLALWSNRFDTTWRDHLKRMPGVRANAAALRDLAVRAGLRGALDLKVVESYDFHPAEAGFAVMPERKEFELGPNEDHLHSVFHVLQRTGNEHLGRVVRRQLDAGAIGAARSVVEMLLGELERGRPIEGRLSSGHHGIPYANFTRDDVLRSLRLTARENIEDGRKFAPASRNQAAPGPAAE